MNNYYDVPLSRTIKEIILGSLLGDGSLKIHRPYKNARFSFRHSINQKEYFDWKVGQLKEISSSKCQWLQKPDKQAFGKELKLRYQSCALEQLTQLYGITHRQGKLKIRRKWLNYLSPLSLAIWWLDDGSIISNGRKGVICTDGFDEASVKIIAHYLKKVWSINTIIAPVKKSQHGKKDVYLRLWLRSTQELQKFLRIILPEIKVADTLPKVLLLYKDHQLQQRWISEIAEATEFSEEIINNFVDLKKSKWKNYQKMI